MGSVFLRGDSWVGEYKDRGKIKRKTFGKKWKVTKTMAKEMLKEIERQIKRGEYDMLDAEIPTLNEFSKSYLERQRDVKQVRSFDRTRIAVNHFGRFFGDRKLNEVTPEDVDIYKQRRLEEMVKLGTIKRELHVIRHLFNQARKWKKFFGENPVSQSGMPEVHDAIERVLTLEEEKRLIEVISEPYKSILLIALNTGMRRNEILRLRWEWIDFENNLINLPQTHTKNKKPRRIYINSVVRKILRERQLQTRGKEFVFPSESTYALIGRLNRAFREACKTAEVENLRLHDLRHTVGTRLGEEGVPIQTISRLLGHTSTRITERYVHPEESVKQATDILANFSNSFTDKFTDKQGAQ